MSFAMFFNSHKTAMVQPEQALPGRDEPMPVTGPHRVLGTSLQPPFPEGMKEVILGMGCFWGAEQRFWQQPGVHTTAVGYAGGHTPNPTYEEVCTAQTGHTEAVRVVYDPARVALEDLLAIFWEAHDPTQGMRQGNDVGTQYRSAIYVTEETDLEQARASRDIYQAVLNEAGLGEITTEIALGQTFYYAEPMHQQYLDRHPGGYCGLAGTGVRFPGLTERA